MFCIKSKKRRELERRILMAEDQRYEQERRAAERLRENRARSQSD